MFRPKAGKGAKSKPDKAAKPKPGDAAKKARGSRFGQLFNMVGAFGRKSRD